MKDRFISVDQARYATYILAKYLETATVNTSTKFYKSTLPYSIMFTKDDASNNYDQVYKLTREFNIRYRDCIGPLICLLYLIIHCGWI